MMAGKDGQQATEATPLHAPKLLRRGKENSILVRRSARVEAMGSKEQGYYRDMEKGARRVRVNDKDKLKIDFEAKKDDISHHLAMAIVCGSGLTATDQIGQAFQEAALKDGIEKGKDLQLLMGQSAND